MTRWTALICLVLISLTQIGAGCQGTETGNPGAPQAGGENGEDGGEDSEGSVQQNETYTNGDFRVSAEYDGTWSFTDNEAPEVSEEPTDSQPDGAEPMMGEEGIDTSDAPSTGFTDGTSGVTIFFVTLNEEPVSLPVYLQQIFPTRTFRTFSNSTGLSGYFYDNPEAGATGGDRQEYYFLSGVTLLYIVTDLFEANDGFQKAETILETLQFE